MKLSGFPTCPHREQINSSKLGFIGISIPWGYRNFECRRVNAMIVLKLVRLAFSIEAT